MAALDALLGGSGKVTSQIAVSRVGALLVTVCRLTRDPPAALRFAIDQLQTRLAELEKPDAGKLPDERLS